MTKKVVVITGAASGIGLALSKACAQQQMQVVMVDCATQRLQEAADQLASMEGLQILAMHCDVTQLESVQCLAQQLFEQFHQVDLLINNAGINAPLLPVWELPLEKTRQIMEVNLFGVLHGIHAFLPRMRDQANRGHIINMASVYGLCSASLVGAYAMSKHAVVALSESLYYDVKRLQYPIDVSVVCPSYVNTPLLNNAYQAFPDDPLYPKLQALFERGRSPDDVAAEILLAIHQKQFYILPDPEVKNYHQQCTQALIEQADPMEHGLEKIMQWISKPL